jgi:hypothetical protein
MKFQESVGFKEWSYVGNALRDGQQSIILRKGGIHEGKAGFSFKHQEFYLFPTWFHTQGEQLRWLPGSLEPMPLPDAERQEVVIDTAAVLKGVWRLTDWDAVQALAPLHIWKEEVVKERFVYDEDSCLHLALLRVYQFSKPWVFPYEAKYGGCRSWVQLPEKPEDIQMNPVCGDGEFSILKNKLKLILQKSEGIDVNV